MMHHTYLIKILIRFNTKNCLFQNYSEFCFLCSNNQKTGNISVDMEVDSPLNQTDAVVEMKNKNICRKRQYLSALIVSLGGFSSGSVLAWTSPALEFLIDHETNRNESVKSFDPPGFQISTSEEAVVGAILNLGALVAAIPSGKCADLMGRKCILILSAILYLVNFILIGFARNVLMLVLARLFAGMGLGAACVVSPMYIGEIADKSVKGVLSSFFNVFIGLGVLYTTIVGVLTNWVGFAITLGLFPLCSGIFMIFLPDTPVYLISTEQMVKAKKSLIFFRNDLTMANNELAYLQKQSLNQSENANICDLLTKRCYRIPLIAGIGVFGLQQLCGINVVVFYTVPIFRAAGSSINPAIAAIITNSIACIMGVISIFFIEKRSRKYFLTLSAFSMMSGVLGLGLFFQLKQLGVSFIGLQILPISSVVLFMTGFAIGLGPVPWILITELYSSEIRGTASGVVVVVNWLCAFLVTLSYPIFMQWIGSYPTFYLYAIVNFLGILFIHFVMPETKYK